MEKSTCRRTHQIPGKYLVFFILFLFMGTSVLISSNQVVSDDPLIIQEEPTNGSMYVSVYLSEVRFTVTGDTVVEYAVTSYPDFTGGIQRVTIEPDGSVSLCALQASDMNAPELSAQVVDRVRTINFGEKDGVQALTIVYPIDFLPAA